MLKKNIEKFRQELKDLGTKNRIIIAFGTNVYNILQKNLQNEFNIFKVTHYSHFINSKNYRDEFSFLIKTQIRSILHEHPLLHSPT